MTKRSTESQTASDIFREANGASGSLSDVIRGTTADDVLRGFGTGSAGAVAGRTSAAIEAATAAINRGDMFGSTVATNEMQRMARGIVGDPDIGSTPTADAIRTAAEGRALTGTQSMVDAATGSLGRSVAKTLADMNVMRGFDASTIAGISSGFDKLGSASLDLEKLIENADRNPLSGYSARELNIIDLPPLPRNPVHRTNELLDTVAAQLSEQRGIIEASAAAQQRETELLATLVAAFTSSQIESEKAAQRSNRQTWMGLALALLGIIVAVAMALLA